MDIEKIREICLAFPGTSEGIKYGDRLCFMVVNKHFCSSDLQTLSTVNFKVSDVEFDALCEREGIDPAPYGGTTYKWVKVAFFDALSEEEWNSLLSRAYELVKLKLPQKVQRTLI
ncbi:MAG: MmcQ/YjbR family DNA-binding protein [Saprospiraceae bacterium]|nr:MmcQ/YjbR family DNA-binding protein [Lewinella sp.]